MATIVKIEQVLLCRKKALVLVYFYFIHNRQGGGQKFFFVIGWVGGIFSLNDNLMTSVHVFVAVVIVVVI